MTQNEFQRVPLKRTVNKTHCPRRVLARADKTRLRQEPLGNIFVLLTPSFGTPASTHGGFASTCRACLKASSPQTRVLVTLAKTQHGPNWVLARAAKTQTAPWRVLAMTDKTRFRQGLLAPTYDKPGTNMSTTDAMLGYAGVRARRVRQHALRVLQGPLPAKSSFSSAR